MTTRIIRPILCSLLVSGSLALAGPASAQDGFFGFLHFGGPSPSASRAEPRVSPYAPLEMRVRPSAPARQGPRWTRRAAPSVASRDTLVAQKEAYAKLNPTSNPTWHLEDPTLRAGDIVVLKRGVMVFAGEKSGLHQEREFQPLAQADSVSMAERQAIGKVSVANAD